MESQINSIQPDRAPRHEVESAPIGIFNETDRLRAVTLWGPLGTEALLAQLYPERISCFLEEMDVPQARKESATFAATLQKMDVQTACARDRLAYSLPLQEGNTDQLISSLIKKAHEIETQYPEQIEKRVEKLMVDIDPSDTQFSREEMRQRVIAGLDNDIRRLVREDVTRYGEAAAIALNKAICLDTKLPLGGALYARDPMNVLLGTRFVSRMTFPIRQPEIEFYEQAYDTILPANTQEAVIPEGETFEGGDAYIHNGTVYVGVGVRTTRGGAEFIYKTLKPQLDAHGLQFAIIEDEHPETRVQEEAMDFMHLDTFSGPIGDKEIAVCDEEAVRRRVKYLETGEDGAVVVVDTGKNFLQHLQEMEDVVIIPRHEQRGFGCNFLAIDDNTIILPSAKNTETIAQLEKRGKNILVVDLFQITRGYGAAHCITGQLRREN